ncbi:hypothetical protein K353_05836 [Kitasatospora sp. SolWspMP-SS2h]|nr:hypothetical protein K353_05836 [Kitasatospora sp. SolWspMP-SS2h]
MPVTSHYALWFSATARWPYRRVGGSVKPRHDGSFLFRTRDPYTETSVDTAAEAVALLVRSLPSQA